MHACVRLGWKGPLASSSSAVTRKASKGVLSMAKKDEEVDRQLSNMARAARKVGPNDRVVELRKVCVLCMGSGCTNRSVFFSCA